MKPDSYKLISQCVEIGVSLGYARAFKHTENPTPEQIKSAIESAVMDEVCEWFWFGDEK